MQKLLVICGPTSTGKTRLAIRVCKKHNGEIISADSRQVYRGMDIGTGKLFSAEVPIWGYDIADPREPFSVSAFLQFAEEKIHEISSQGKLPILVGGTGFYIKAIVDGVPTAAVPVDDVLRQRLSEKNADELLLLLIKLDPLKAQSFNESDRANPRRLIRAIEVAQSKQSVSLLPSDSYNLCMIGLTASKDVLYQRVENSIQKRVELGVFQEIETLLAQGVAWEDQSMSSLGYRQLHGLFDNTKTQNDAVEEWIAAEKKYVKRQLTWFKKDPRIIWFDIVSPTFESQVEEFIETWDNTI